MKKFLKWFAIAIGSLIVLIVIAGFIIRWYFNSFESEYPSGGELSGNQQNFDVLFYDINLKILFDEEAIAGNTIVKIECLVDNLDLIELDLIDLFKVESVSISNQNVKFQHLAHKLFITPNENINRNDIIDIKVIYSGQPPEAKYPPWLGGFTWEKDDSNNAWIGLSCQGEGAKIWIPCKDHPMDEADSAAINITVPADYYVAANGILEKTTVDENKLKTYHWFTRYPINNYLINFGIGKFVEVKNEYIAGDGTKVPVIFYVLPQLQEGSTQFVEQAVDGLKSYAKFFGEYPWKNEKCAFLNTPFSGMEHQTLISYGNNYRKTEIDSFSFDPLLIHELAHEWWGNKVTVYDWADFWIHEGISTYAEALYVLDRTSEETYHKYMARTKQRIINNQPLISEPNSNSSEAYHPDIYSKGAAFVHTLRYVLGDSIFFPTLKQFATDSIYTLQNKVDTEDFLELLNQNSGKDLTALFDLYLNTTDLPIIHVDSVSTNIFNIYIPNINFETPMDVSYNNTTERMMLGPDTLQITSNHWPVVDSKDWYLKKD